MELPDSSQFANVSGNYHSNGSALYKTFARTVKFVGGLEDGIEKKGAVIRSYIDDPEKLLESGETLDDGKSVDDVVAELKGLCEGVISETDRLKLAGWRYKPSDELYLKYKDVFDNPKYYNQKTRYQYE